MASVDREIGRLDGRLSEVSHRIDRVVGRVDSLEKGITANGNAGLTKAERLAILTGAPIIIAAVIAALVQILHIGGAT